MVHWTAVAALAVIAAFGWTFAIYNANRADKLEDELLLMRRRERLR